MLTRYTVLILVILPHCVIHVIYLLYFIAGLDAFRTFLKSEFSEENVEFWLACEDFKKTESAEKIASKARMIYSEFIEADAPKEVSQTSRESEYSSPSKSASN